MTLPLETLYSNTDSIILSKDKLCRRCKNNLPLFHFCKHSGQADGLNMICRTCAAEIKGAKRPRNYHLIPCPDGYKICSACRIAKPKNDFHKSLSRKDGLGSQCALCAGIASKKWAEENKERRNANTKAWREANREYSRNKYKERYQLNGEEMRRQGKEYRENNKEELRARQIAYARSHWELVALRRCRVRARKKGLPFDMKPEDILPLPVFCPVLGFKLDYNAGPEMRLYASVDRIIPRLGYVTGNVRIISYAANVAKLDGEGDVFQISYVAGV